MTDNPPENRQKTGQFKKGVSGNPGGRPKITDEDRDVLAEIRTLASSVPNKMRTMLNSSKTPVAVKVKICEIILERTYGKPDSKVVVTSPDFSALDEAFKGLGQK